VLFGWPYGFNWVDKLILESTILTLISDESPSRNPEKIPSALSSSLSFILPIENALGLEWINFA
jgi:hypothetical protein